MEHLESKGKKVFKCQKSPPTSHLEDICKRRRAQDTQTVLPGGKSSAESHGVMLLLRFGRLQLGHL